MNAPTLTGIHRVINALRPASERLESPMEPPKITGIHRVVRAFEADAASRQQNELPDLLNRAGIKRWIPIGVAGEFPHSSGVVQVIDNRAMDAIASQPIPAEGIQLDFDHYSSLTEEERGVLKRLGIQLPSNAAGWIKKLARRTVDGLDKIFGLVDFTPEGERAIANKEYVWTSPVHPRAALENLGNGKVRPLAISKVALTNEPNIRAIGSLLNRRGLLDLENSNPEEKWITINGRPVRIESVVDISKT